MEESEAAVMGRVCLEPATSLCVVVSYSLFSRKMTNVTWSSLLRSLSFQGMPGQWVQETGGVIIRVPPNNLPFSNLKVNANPEVLL